MGEAFPLKKQYIWLILSVIVALLLGSPLIYSIIRTRPALGENIKAEEMLLYDVNKEEMVHYDEQD